MNELVYPRERVLGTITLILGLLIWLGLIVGTFGVALLILAAGFILYLFAQSALIAHIKGNGVELTEEQFPELYAQFVECCERLQIKQRPEAYILNGDGGLNAFATKFLGTQFVVLMSDVVDAMRRHPDGVKFYIGHELGHLRMKHLSGHLFRWPALWLPLVGAAYSRAQESTCDRHGLACSATPEGAVRSMAALSAGVELWQSINVASYLKQATHSSGFWMSFHELIAGYPWLTKRAARVMDTTASMPKRNPFAYLLALFVPHAGRLGAGFGMLIMVYVIGVMAAIAIPAYNDYKVKAILHTTVIQTEEARQALAGYYEKKGKIPKSLNSVGISSELPDGTQLMMSQEDMILTVLTPKGELVFTPAVDGDGKIVWDCANGEGIKQSQLPPNCTRLEE